MISVITELKILGFSNKVARITTSAATGCCYDKLTNQGAGFNLLTQTGRETSFAARQAMGCGKSSNINLQTATQ